MKILIVSRSFFPENSPRSFRATELAVELLNRGNDVTVAIPRNYLPALSDQRFKGLTALDLGPVSWPEISISHPNRLLSLTKRALRRGLNLAFDYPDIELRSRVITAMKGVRGFDLAISIAAPHPVHWGFCRARKSNREICQTWVADCGDPYVGVTIDTFRKPFYFAWLEKAFCRQADFITIPIESARQAYFPEFHSKIRVIPQGLRLPLPGNLPTYTPNPVPTFVYCGGFLPGVRDPRPLLEYLSQVEKPFFFVCYTRQGDLFANYATRLKGKLSVRPYIPREQMLAELARADFLLNLENRTDRQSPSKLIDYSIAQRPILSLDSQSINTTVVDDFLNGDYTHRAVVPDPATYDISTVAARFEALHHEHFEAARRA